MTQLILPMISGLFFVFGAALFAMAWQDAKQNRPIASRSRKKVAVIFWIVTAGLTACYLLFR